MIAIVPHESAPERPDVTDSSPWQPPAGMGGAAASGTAPFAPPSGVPVPPAGPQAGWTPPPKPGLIPLRPLTLGTLLGASFQVLRRNPRPMFGFALLVTGVVFFASFLLVGLVAFFAFSRAASATGEDAATVTAGSFALVVLAGLISVALSLVASAILQGIVSLEVARGTVGEKLRLGGLWRAARGRIGALIGWTLLITAAVLVVVVVLAVVIGLIATFGGVAGTVVAVLLGIAAFFGALVLGAWLATKLSLVPSAIMIERLPLRAALSRSWSLTIGFFWKTLGVQLLVAVIVSFVTNIVATPLQLVIGFGSSLINPNDEQNAAIVGVVIAYILTVILTVVVGAIGSVMQSATAALIYIDLRMRREGLDLELQHFVEARQAGDTSVSDPYALAARSVPGAAAAAAAPTADAAPTTPPPPPAVPAP